ncbi:retrotransposable element tf2 155 kda protein type 1 [Plakobranchus ocellatus]|uniref:Retrotransposable element tf2 155 kDa protein type 1 n=1 Tax=Plakobranchus ocellatus TaxID=259542 RepID=A0AAV3ZXZ6_9GAST|nr:retrotransposable element tf2 155 kda protein type 1 [Plakobranchus ocellatus]
MHVRGAESNILQDRALLLEKKCSACGKPNHFKDVCRSSRVHDLANKESDSDDYEEGEKRLFVGTIGRKTYEDRDELFVHADVLGTSIKFKVDTGAQVNILPQKVYQRLKDVAMTKTTQKPTSYTGNRLRVLGKCTIEVMGVPLDFFVTDTNQDAILLPRFESISKPTTNQNNDSRPKGQGSREVKA